MDADAFIDGLANNELIVPFRKPSFGTNAGVVGILRGTGKPPAGNIPTTATVCTNALLGAFTLPTLSSGQVYYLSELYMSNSSANRRTLLFDRLAHMGGLSATVASPTAQTVGVSVVGMDPDRLGNSDFGEVQWFLEHYSPTGATPVTIDVDYTNGAGTSGRSTTVQMVASSALGLMTPIVGSSFESIQSIQSITLQSAGASAGNFGVTAVRLVAESFSTVAYVVNPKSFTGTRLRKIPKESCLILAAATDSSTGTIDGHLRLFSGPA